MEYPGDNPEKRVARAIVERLQHDCPNITKHFSDPRFIRLVLSRVGVGTIDEAVIWAYDVIQKLDELSEIDRQRGNNRNTTN